MGEKSDARSREVKRRNRWSWGGNIHDVFGTDMLDTGEEELPSRLRPTALPKSMQSWIAGLRSYEGDDDQDSLSGSLISTPRDQNRSLNSSFTVSDRLLTPTAASRAKRYTPEGEASPSENGDAKLRRRTVSTEHINRLATPRARPEISLNGPEGDRGRSLASPHQKSGRVTPKVRSRQSSREGWTSSARTEPDGAVSRPKPTQPKKPVATGGAAASATNGTLNGSANGTPVAATMNQSRGEPSRGATTPTGGVKMRRSAPPKASPSLSRQTAQNGTTGVSQQSRTQTTPTP